MIPNLQEFNQRVDRANMNRTMIKISTGGADARDPGGAVLRDV
jgi:hypothetical protein